MKNNDFEPKNAAFEVDKHLMTAYSFCHGPFYQDVPRSQGDSDHFHKMKRFITTIHTKE
jgi:hypothetical protein